MASGFEIPADYYVLRRNGSWGFHLDGWGLIADGFDSYAEAARAARQHSFTLDDDAVAA